MLSADAAGADAVRANGFRHGVEQGARRRDGPL